MMMKKITAVFAALAIVGVSVTPSQAADQLVIAIVDSGFDTSLLGDSVIQEVCVLGFNIGCNNYKGLDVGPGSAGTTSKLRDRYLSDWGHGTDMALAALALNPETKFVLIRNAKVFNQVAIQGGEKDLEAALQWVEDNAAAYGIDAVSVSRGDHRYVAKGGGDSAQFQRIVDLYSKIIDRFVSRGISGKSVDGLIAMRDKYQEKLDNATLLECPASVALSTNVSDLLLMNIPTFVAAGNDGSRSYLDTPACIDAVFAVSAADDQGQLLKNSNFSSTKTDFVMNAPNTSTATIKMAVTWGMGLAESGLPMAGTNASVVLAN
jgi:hypothetical protein